MPAHIGFIDTLKVGVAMIAQLGPTKFNSKMGAMTPGAMYKMRKEHVESRNTYFTSYGGFRHHLNRFDPNKKAPTSKGQIVVYLDAVDRNEWNLYLETDTMFDKTVRAALDKNDGWKVFFVSEGASPAGQKKLKRIEAKHGKGHMSITLWSAKGGVASDLA